MSGGSMDYLYYKLHDSCVGKMSDKFMDALIADLVYVIHDLEWWDSGDIDEEDYKRSVNKFKQKWMGKDTEVVERIIQEECDKLKEELIQSLKY